jgi:hypothetical protein
MRNREVPKAITVLGEKGKTLKDIDWDGRI